MGNETSHSDETIRDYLIRDSTNKVIAGSQNDEALLKKQILEKLRKDETDSREKSVTNEITTQKELKKEERIAKEKEREQRERINYFHKVLNNIHSMIISRIKKNDFKVINENTIELFFALPDIMTMDESCIVELIENQSKYKTYNPYVYKWLTMKIGTESYYSFDKDAYNDYIVKYFNEKLNYHLVKNIYIVQHYPVPYYREKWIFATISTQ